MFKRSTLIQRASLAASALVLTAVASGCGGGGPGPVPTTGSIRAAGQFSSSGAPVCTDSSTWVYSPVTLEATAEGTAQQIVHTHTGGTLTPTSGVCTSTDNGLSLRFGTWRVTWSGRPGVACDLNTRTNNWVTIETNGNCKKTF